MSTQPISYPAGPTLVVPGYRGFSWTGIFAGTFLFLAIEATFGVLGVAIFATAASPNSPNPVGPGISFGAGIWMVVLSIIALYFGGKLASKLSGSITRNIGMYAGLVTFGMSIFATFLIAALTLGSTALGVATVTGALRVADLLIYGGYWLFVALVLGMIAAASGGMHGAWVSEQRSVTSDRSDESKEDFRRAA